MSLQENAAVMGTLRRKNVAFAALFGSRAKGVATPASDYDFLIEFKPEMKYSLFDIVDVKDELEQVLHTKVDVLTTGGMNPRLKEEILQTMQVLYDER